MIKSMTAFARKESVAGDTGVVVEIRTYNSRNLDLALRIPQAYFQFEDKLKGVIAEQVVRGRVEVWLQIREAGEEANDFEVNEAKALAYHGALVRLGGILGLSPEISLSQMAGVPGLIQPVERERDLDALWGVVREAAVSALADLDQMRRREGEFLARDFTERLSFIAGALDEIVSQSSDLLPRYRDRLQERIAALTGGMVEIDPGRIAQEAAFLADRSDISEEIVRARSHLVQFRDIMSGEEAGGRQLNFLLQELNREFNTMGSKAGNAAVSHIIVKVKAELEKIREQVQNIE